jgi:hypothetical protein
LDTIRDAKQREWYIRQAIQSGWSRNVVVIGAETLGQSGERPENVPLEPWDWQKIEIALTQELSELKQAA